MNEELNVLDARDLIKESEKNILQLIDVRKKNEYTQIAIDGFSNIPLSDLTQFISQLDSKKKTLLLCHKGQDSQQAQKLLESCGFNNSYIIRGGIDMWAQVIDRSLERY